MPDWMSGGAAAVKTAPIDPNNPPGDPTHKLLTEFRLCNETKAQLNSRGIYRLFPIQSATFDYIYEGKDVIGRAVRCLVIMSLPSIPTLYSVLVPARRSPSLSPSLSAYC